MRAALGRAMAGGAKAIAVTQCLYGGVDLDIYAVGTDARKAGISDGGYMTTEYAVAWMMREVVVDYNIKCNTTNMDIILTFV